MPVYKESKSNEYHIEILYDMYAYNKEPDDMIRVRFYKNEKLHRTDGPAIITWRPVAPSKGATKLYYLKDKMIDPIEYIRIMNLPMRDLPLHLNLEPYSMIVKDRLAGTRTEIDLDSHSILEPMILKKMWAITPEQVLIKDLINKLNRAIAKNLKHVKPFQINHRF